MRYEGARKADLEWWHRLGGWLSGQVSRPSQSVPTVPYRESAAPPRVTYQPIWRIYRNRGLTNSLLLASWMPGGGCLLMLGGWLFGPYGFLCLLPLFAAVMVAGFRLVHTPCPRCERPLHRPNGSSRKGLSKECVHCGLPIGSPDPPPHAIVE
jgi:hypothetical protein